MAICRFCFTLYNYLLFKVFYPSCSFVIILSISLESSCIILLSIPENIKRRSATTVSDSINRLLARIRVKSNVSCNSYLSTLKPFNDRFGQLDCSDVTRATIREYISSLPLSLSSKGLKFAHIKAVFDEAQQALIESGHPLTWANPCSSLSAEFSVSHQKRKRLPSATRKNMKDIKDTLRPKHLIMYDLGTKVGLRVTEIISITPSNLIRTGEEYAIVSEEANTGETYMRKIPADLYQRLMQYIEKNKIGEHSRIFPLTRQTVYQVFKSRGVTPHDLRLYHLETTSLWISFYIAPIIHSVEHTTVGTTVRYEEKRIELK